MLNDNGMSGVLCIPMKRILIAGLVLLVILVALGFLIVRLGVRSGVTEAQVAEALPGDEMFPQPWVTIDRAATFATSSAAVWPWVVQLGSERAGWYAPMWLEDLLRKYSATTTLAQYQTLAVGEQIPDFGGGALRVLAIAPGQYIEYCSIPNINYMGDQCNFTWTLILENNTASSTTFHLRLRIPEPTHYTWLPAALPGMFDYLADEAMFAGLKENLSR